MSISPGCAVRHVAIVVVDDAHIDAGHGAAEGTGADLARLVAVGEHAHHLGHAPQLDHREAEAGLEGGVKLRLDAGAEAEAHTVRAVLRARRLAEQQRRDDAEVVHDGRPRLGDLAPPVLGMEAVGLHLGVAGEDGAHQRHDAGVDVIERQWIVDALLADTDVGRAAERRIPGAGGDLVAVREDAALGPAGRARRVEDAGGRIRARRSTGPPHASLSADRMERYRRAPRAPCACFEPRLPAPAARGRRAPARDRACCGRRDRPSRRRDTRD